MRKRRTSYLHTSLTFTLLALFFVATDAVQYFYLTNIGKPIELSLHVWYHTVFAVVFGSQTILRDGAASRWFQIITLTLYSAAAIYLMTPRLPNGELLTYVAMLLAYKYGLLARAPIPKVLLISVPWLIARGAVALSGQPGMLVHSLNLAAILPVTIALSYWLFEEELQRVRERASLLEDERRMQRPFVEFGRNVAGIVHDFKNDVSLFSGYAQMLNLRRGSQIEQTDVAQLRRYVDRLNVRVERILAVTRAAHQVEPRDVKLNELLESSLYVFQSNLDFGRAISFSFFPDERLTTIRVAPSHLATIVENVVRNSCEALVEAQSDSLSGGQVIVSTRRVDEQHVEIRISDDGPGIAECEDCPKSNCLDCLSKHAGNSTKPGGTGMGLRNVQLSAAAIGAEVHMKSLLGKGVTTTIVLPLAPRVASGHNQQNQLTTT